MGTTDRIQAICDGRQLMKKGNQKSKGNSYEIKIARILSQWYEPGTKDDLFWRTAGSGAKATVTRRGQTSFVGDITFLPRPDALRVWIDTKDRRDASFDNILTNFIVRDWYENEVEKQNNLISIPVNRKPVIIIFKLYGKKEDYIFFSTKDFEFTDYGNGWPGNWIEWEHFTIMLFDKFLSRVKRKKIIDK